MVCVYYVYYQDGWMVGGVIVVINTKHSSFSAIFSWREQLTFQWDNDDVRFVLEQHTWLNFIVLVH